MLTLNGCILLNLYVGSMFKIAFRCALFYSIDIEPSKSLEKV